MRQAEWGRQTTKTHVHHAGVPILPIDPTYRPTSTGVPICVAQLDYHVVVVDPRLDLSQPHDNYLGID